MKSVHDHCGNDGDSVVNWGASVVVVVAALAYDIAIRTTEKIANKTWAFMFGWNAD